MCFGSVGVLRPSADPGQRRGGTGPFHMQKGSAALASAVDAVKGPRLPCVATATGGCSAQKDSQGIAAAPCALIGYFFDDVLQFGCALGCAGSVCTPTGNGPGGRKRRRLRVIT